ncbi:MAG: DUF4810 domain-containing protein [Burkholderiaceae bacterium]
MAGGISIVAGYFCAARRLRRLVPAGIVCALLTACETVPPLYAWGTYDKSVERVVAPGDGFEIQAEIARLSAEMRQVTDADRQLPPGYRIHLAYLYLLQGDRASAQELLDAEKMRFPESRSFIDDLMARTMRQPALKKSQGVSQGAATAAGNKANVSVTNGSQQK